MRNIASKIDVKMNEDKEIVSEQAKLGYFNLVTTNLRSNNKTIIRNSFWMTLSVLVYFLILNERNSITNISILFFTVENSLLIVNIIPVFFAYLFLQNIAIWNNNINLYRKFEDLSQQLFHLGLLSDTKNVIKPFMLTHHVLNYQYENKRIKTVFKLPVIIILIIMMFFPILFIGNGIYNIIVLNPPSFIPITCGLLSGFIGFSSILQARSVYKS